MSIRNQWAAPAAAAVAVLVAACGGGPAAVPAAPAAVQSAPPTAAAQAAGVAVAPSPPPGTTRIEAEGLATRSTTHDPVGPQPDCCGVRWSAGRQLWFRAQGAGRAVDLAFDVARDGTYRVDVVVTLAPDYGIISLGLDGQTRVSGFDAYVPGSVGRSVEIAPVTLGTAIPLRAGAHTLTVTVTGRNPASASTFAGVDYLDLTPG